MVVLLQQGKGGDIASAFGGGSSQAAFGARSGATVLSRATTVCAVLFIVGALALGIAGAERSGLGGRRPRRLLPRRQDRRSAAPPTPKHARPQRDAGQKAPRRRAPAPASQRSSVRGWRLEAALTLHAEVAELADAPA